MKPLYTPKEFEDAKSRDQMPLKCLQCGDTYFLPKNQIQTASKDSSDSGKFCSLSCSKKYWRRGSSVKVSCKKCGTVFPKDIARIRKTKNNFCSKSCAAKWNNAHKKHGTRRSKLEKWLARKLPTLYPDIEFHFNRKDAINSELDIYIPSLKLAFELNGIFHYEPIFGPEKLASVQNNDQRKFAACHEAEISLCSIDTSGMNYFKPKKAEKYLSIISELINSHLDS